MDPEHIVEGIDEPHYRLLYKRLRRTGLIRLLQNLETMGLAGSNNEWPG